MPPGKRSCWRNPERMRYELSRIVPSTDGSVEGEVSLHARSHLSAAHSQPTMISHMENQYVKYREIIALLLAISVLATSVPAQARCAAPRISQGMNYGKARRIAIAAGFQTPSLPAYGYSKDDPKVVSECFGNPTLCNKFPEIDSCSGQGQCTMKFSDAYGTTLSISTYGPLDQNGPTVTSFDVSCGTRHR